jgi:hypothetical protein
MIELRRPAPALGRHTRQVLVDELGVPPARFGEWQEQGLV